MAAPMGCTRLIKLCRKMLVFSSLSSRLPLSSFRYSSSLKVNHDVQLVEEVGHMLVGGEIKPRRHPGIMKISAELPSRMSQAIAVLNKKYPVDELEKKIKKFRHYLWSRGLPAEPETLRNKAKEMEEKIMSQENIDLETMTEDEREANKSLVINKVVHALKKNTYHWKPINYNAEKSFLYLMSRAAIDYFGLLHIFSEIRKRTPDFQPQTLFDFGSGVCTATWAANRVWNNTLTEHYCFDPSSDMNTIAQLILQGGEEESDMHFPHVYFRQYFPAGGENEYDLVNSAFSLMELPTHDQRLNAVLNLWRKTKQFLVIVENGTNAGFNIISEAREFLLQLGEEESMQDEDLMGHVFAPCPHDHACPRVARQDNTPCNFPVHLPKTPNKKMEGTNISYVVLRKGRRSDSAISWPRIVRPTSNPSRHVHIRTCTPDGSLESAVITAKKHTKELYRCSRASQWGDLLPVSSPAWQTASPDTYCDKNTGKGTISDLTHSPLESQENDNAGHYETSGSSNHPERKNENIKASSNDCSPLSS